MTKPQSILQQCVEHVRNEFERKDEVSLNANETKAKSTQVHTFIEPFRKTTSYVHAPPPTYGDFKSSYKARNSSNFAHNQEKLNNERLRFPYRP